MVKNYDYVAAKLNVGATKSWNQKETSQKYFNTNWIGFVSMFLMLFSFVFSQAQSTANYTFVTNATSSLALDATGNVIDMTTGTTQVLAAGVDDTVSPLTNLNLNSGSTFDFFFQSNRYSQFAVSDNGLLTLGVTPGTSTYVIGSATIPTISAFANDMRMGTDGKVEAKVVGSGLNRTLVVQWTNVTIRYAGTAGVGTATFQVRLYESTGIIEYVYGSMGTNASTPTVYNVGFSSAATSNNIASVNTTTNTVSTTTPLITNSYVASSTVAELHSTADGARRSYMFVPPGNAANTVATTLAPPTDLTFTGTTAATTTLNWVGSAPTTSILKYAIYRSTDGGLNYSYVATTPVATTTYSALGLSPSTNYFWKVYAISEGGKSTDLTSSVTTLAAGNISAIATGLWSATTTWSGGIVPTATDNVTIPAGFVVTEDVTAAAAYSLLVQGDLVYTATTARVLTVVTNVTIDAGASFKSAATGTVLTHSLLVGGNLVNNGTLDFSTNGVTAGATITFNTAGSANFTLGAASVTNLRNSAGVTLNKGNNISNVLTFTPGGTLTVQGANALGFMVVTNGLLQLDGANAFANPLFATAGYTIAANGGFWLNNANASIEPLAGSPTVTGLLRISSGTFNVGTASGNSMGFSANSTINIEGGTINAASRFGVATAANRITYNQTGGTINVNRVGNVSTTLASFDLGTNATSIISFTAGTVNVVLANTAASGPRDVRGTALFTPNFAGTGVINFGTAASSATPTTYFVSGNVPALTISTESAIHNLSVAAANTQSFGNVTIPTGSTFNLNGFQFILRGSSVINNGTLTGTAAGSSLYFFAGSVPQSYSGTGVCTPGLVSLTVDTAPNNFTIDASTSGINSLRVNLFSGNVINSNKITIGTGAALACVVQIGAAGIVTPAGNFDVSPVFNLGTGAYSIIYSNESTPRTTGFEIPSTRSITNLTLDNVNGLVLAGGTTEVTNALTLTNGIVTATAANYLIHGSATAAGTLTGGSATAHINGPIVRTVNDANANYILFPVGKGGVYAPISLAPTTTSVSRFSAETFATNAGTENASIINLSANRRWEAPLVSGTFTDMNVRIADANLIATNIPVQAPTAAGQYTASFGSVATFAAATPNTVQSNFAVASASYSGFLSYAISNSCTGTPAPGATTASSASLCLGQSTTLGITTVPAGSGITYQWQSSTDGTAYTDIAGATSLNYLATPTTATFYQCVVTCSAGPASGTSTPIQIVFSNAIASTTPAARCGVGSVVLAATANSGAVVTWYAASSGGSALATGTSFTTPSITETTTYYAAATTSAPAAIVLGLGATNSATTAASFLPGAWGGAKTQYLIRASELIQAGLVAGPITNLGFEPTNSGQTYQGFFVYVGQTTDVTAPATTFVPNSGLSLVYSGTEANDGFTPVANTVNNLAFGTGTGTSSSFNWDGTSNVLVSFSWSRVPSASTATSTTMKVDNVGFVSAAYRQRDNFTPMAMADETSVTGTSSNRPRFQINGIGICSSERVPVVATFNAAPAFALATNAFAICNGDTSSAVTITTGATDYDTYVWTPATGVSGNATTGWTFNPTVSTIYTLNVSQSSGTLCATSATLNVTVNPLPTPIVVTPTAGSICVNAIQSLTATGGSNTFGGSSAVGTDVTSTTQNNLDPTAFNNRFEHYWLQMVFTQAELLAAGVQAGNINSLTFDITTIGSAPNVTDFRVNMGSTAQSVLTGFTPTGLTEVFAAPTYTQTLGSNTITLTTPYVWDGTSNIIVDLRNTGIDSANNASTLFTATTDVKTVSAITSTTFPSSNDFVASNPTATTSLKRLNTIFGWESIVQNPIDWSPATNLFTDAAATVPYVSGANATTVYVKPATAGTTIYTATATSTAGCFSSGTTTVTSIDCDIQYANLQFPGTSTIGTCGSETFYARVYKAGVTEPAGQGAGITAWIGTNTTNTDPSTWAESSWQLATFNVQTDNNDEYQATFSNLAAGTYYVASRFVFSPGAFVYGGYTPTGGGFWGGSNISAVLTVNATATPTATSPQSFVAPATIANIVLAATGTVTWYATLADANANVNPLPTSTLLVDNTTYYATQTENGCPSAAVAVLVNVTLGNNEFNAAALSYYPNPTRGVITFDYSNTISNLKVINMLGQEVRSAKYNSTSVQLDMNGLASGTYIVEITSEGLVKQVKVVKAD